MRLIGSIKTPRELTSTHHGRMFELMSGHFDGVTRDNFEHDLSEKQWVVLLRDSVSGEIQGFSTLMLLDAMVMGEPIKAVFSGDTIVHRDYWGETELASVWGQFILSLIESYQGIKFYWFLISKGYRTYRFLPVYFSEFYPRFDKETPEFERVLMEVLAERKFPSHYLPELGILRFDEEKDRLKPDLAEVSVLRKKDPHVAFFHDKNPGYVQGDELVCVAQLSEENLKPVALKVVARAKRAAQFS